MTDVVCITKKNITSHNLNNIFNAIHVLCVMCIQNPVFVT